MRSWLAARLAMRSRVVYGFVACRLQGLCIRVLRLQAKTITKTHSIYHEASAVTLRSKFNLAMILATLVGLLAAGLLSYFILMRDARQAILSSAQILLEGALSVRRYTVNEVRPLLQKVETDQFLPQTVPAYAASRVIAHLQEKYPDYSYKEAALNPTNPANRAVDWEEDLIQWFKAHPDRQELTGERQTPTGSSLYISRPIRITNPACLGCHGDPATAPPSLIKRYGKINGFGWKLNDIVGVQVVSVPQTVQLKTAWRQFAIFMGSLVVIMILLALVLNFLLRRFVVRPVAEISAHAEAISTGNQVTEEIQLRGSDEIASLARSFNRMQRSLNSAVQMINDSMK